MFRNASIAILLLAAPASAGTSSAVFDVPDLDRWNYPFNASPGIRTAASTFGALGLDGFDDRDAQFLLGFDTGVGMNPDIEPGLGAARYDITSAQVTITVLEAGAIPYDPTKDALETYYEETDPDFQPDPDAGRPVEIYGVSFRNGFDAASFMESSPYGDGFSEGGRNAFPTDFEMGVSRDVSNNVRDRFEVFPFAVGQADSLNPGDAVSPDTVFTFTLDVNDQDVQAYLRDAVNNGRLRFMVTSLHFATGGPGGGKGDITYPSFYTKENKFAIPFGLAATLDITVDITDPIAGDLNGDGAVNAMDLANLLGFWGTDNQDADLDNDGNVGASDLATLLGNWTG